MDMTDNRKMDTIDNRQMDTTDNRQQTNAFLGFVAKNEKKE